MENATAREAHGLILEAGKEFNREIRSVKKRAFIMSLSILAYPMLVSCANLLPMLLNTYHLMTTVKNMTIFLVPEIQRTKPSGFKYRPWQ